MSRSNKPQKLIQDDDRLAEFTDQVMAGRIKQAESNVDEELIDLEKTILRLNATFPPTSLEEGTVKQMQVRLNARIRREKQEIKPSFWGKWFGAGQPHLQIGWVLTAVTMLVIFLFVIPSLASSSSSTTATALTTTLNMFVVIALAGIILVVLWVMRRK